MITIDKSGQHNSMNRETIDDYRKMLFLLSWRIILSILKKYLPIMFLGVANMVILGSIVSIKKLISILFID
jgi:hypothetical protein